MFVGMDLIKGDILLDYVYNEKHMVVEVMQSDTMRYKVVLMSDYSNKIYYLDKTLFCESSRLRFSVSKETKRRIKMDSLI